MEETTTAHILILDNHGTNFLLHNLMFWFCSTTQTNRYQHSPPFSKLKFVTSIDLVSSVVAVVVFVILSVGIIVLLSLLLSLLSTFRNRCRHSHCGCHRATISAYQPATASVYQRCYSSLNHQLQFDFPYFSIHFKRQ